MRPTRQAFTVVELLVVITILSILAALLLPSLRNAKDMAEKAYCMSNLKQCAVSLLAYAQDNRDYMPPPAQVTGNPHLIRYGSYRLAPYLVDYLGDFEAWKCGALTKGATIDDPANTAGSSYGTFLLFPGHTGPSFGTAGPVPLKSQQLAEEGWVVMQDNVYEHNWGAFAGFRSNHGTGRIVYPYPSNPSCVLRIGGDPNGGNLSFADAHVEWVEYADMVKVGDSRYSLRPRAP